MPDHSNSPAENTTVSAEPVAASPTGFAKGRWAACLLVAAVAAWAAYHFVPDFFELPLRLVKIDDTTPKPIQDEAMVKIAEVHRNNTIVDLTLAGLCFGAVGLMFTGWAGARWAAQAVVGLLAGALFGAAAGIAGLAVREALSRPDMTLSFLAESNRQIASDAIVFLVTSVLLAAPVAALFLASREEQRVQKALAVVMGGAIAGLLLPVVSSLAMPDARTDIFPPDSMGLTALWFVALAGLVFVFSIMTGSRKA